MNQIKIVFIGTGDIGVPLLEKLATDNRFDVELVVTQVDKPAKRKMIMTPPPTKLKAMALGVEVFQPENINEDHSLEKIKEANPDMID